MNWFNFIFLICWASASNMSARGVDVVPDRVAEALLYIVDIPIDVGVVCERPFEPDRVATAIRQLDGFSLNEIQAAVSLYWQRKLSDGFSDKMVKMHLINAYLFRTPEKIVADDELLSGGSTFFEGVRRKDGKLNLAYPWVFTPAGQRRIATKSLYSVRVSGTGYDGPTQFAIYKQRFGRRFQKKE